MIQFLRQRMQLGQASDRLYDLSRKQACHRWHNPLELSIPVGEVDRPVQIAEKEMRGGAVARAGSEIRVVAAEAFVLILLDCSHTAGKPCVGLARGAKTR